MLLKQSLSLLLFAVLPPAIAASNPCLSKAITECGHIQVGSAVVADLAKSCGSPSDGTVWTWCLARGALAQNEVVVASELDEVDACLQRVSCQCEDSGRARKLQSCEEPPNPICFSQKATVQVQGKGTIAMKDLKAGQDLVKTQEGQYEMVYAFAHYSPDSHSAEFLQIFTGSNAPLEISPHHLVFLRGKYNPVTADLIVVGDELQTGDTSVGAVVTKISSVWRRGLYTPLTPSGTVVVDGIRASTYVSLQPGKGQEYVELSGGIHVMSQHAFVSMAIAPFRLVCHHLRLSGSGFCNVNEDSGMPRYISQGLRLATWFDSLVLSVAAQAVLLGLTLLGFALVLALESLFTVPFIFLQVFVTAVAAYFYMRTPATKRMRISKAPLSRLTFALAILGLSLTSAEALCSKGGSDILGACGETILGTVGSEEVTLADVAEQGGCQEEIGSFAWFYCTEKALQDIPLDLNPISTCLEGLWSVGHTTPKMRGLSGAVGESCSGHSDCCGYCKSSGQCANKKEDESLCNDGEECTSCYCLSAIPINGFRGICGNGGGQCGFGGSGGPGTGPTPTPCGGGCSSLGGCSSGCRCSITAGQVTGICV